MKEVSSIIEYKGKEYKIVFNLNVMQEIQEEYGSLREWGEKTDGKNEKGEPITVSAESFNALHDNDAE